MSYFQTLIDWIIATKPTKQQIHVKKLELCKVFHVKHVPTDIEVYMNASSQTLEAVRLYLQTKPVRTGSGVAIIAIMTLPSVCPHGACTFCPGGLGSVYGDTPQSYTGTEPSTMRSMRHNYDPYRVIFNRLQQYIILGQHPDKCEQIIQGGTFASYPVEYQEQFCYLSFKAYNDFSMLFFDQNGELLLDKFKSFFELPCAVADISRQERIKQKILVVKETNHTNLETEQIRNESVAIRCIGLTIETKPDWGLASHGLEFLRLGATRVELGVQTVYDEILRATNRGHTIAETHQSIADLRDLGFKLNFHIMPGLPDENGKRINEEKDLESIRLMFQDSHYMPDMIKIYPCMVMPGTPLYTQYKAGIFVPLNTLEAAKLIAESYKLVPEWCRIMRVQRDIPTFSTEAGVNKTNLRQYVDDYAQKHNIICKDIRAREIKKKTVQSTPEIVIREYIASEGQEFFLAFEADNQLLGFARLRFPKRSLHPALTPESAIIRELHVYGPSVAIGTSDPSKAQHQGFGTRLMKYAEELARKKGKNKMVVISGVGVRNYYRNLGYEREGPYMVKKLC